MTHDKISFTREYCRCRRIPYHFDKESLYIDNHYICYSIFNIPYTEIVPLVDKHVAYDSLGFYSYYLKEDVR